MRCLVNDLKDFVSSIKLRKYRQKSLEDVANELQVRNVSKSFSLIFRTI